jgi:hypothetical protein
MNFLVLFFDGFGMKMDVGCVVDLVLDNGINSFNFSIWHGLEVVILYCCIYRKGK